MNFCGGVQNGVFWLGGKKFMLKKMYVLFGPLNKYTADYTKYFLGI